MTLDRCPLSILCSRGTPPRAVEPTNPGSIKSARRPNAETQTRLQAFKGPPQTHFVNARTNNAWFAKVSTLWK